MHPGHMTFDSQPTFNRQYHFDTTTEIPITSKSEDQGRLVNNSNVVWEINPVWMALTVRVIEILWVFVLCGVSSHLDFNISKVIFS